MAPVLIFDSGVGGLSVLGAIRAVLPALPVVYAADNAGFPYGIRTESDIAARVPALLGRLVERYRPRLVVIACNTASTIALDAVRAGLDLPVVGTVPAIKPAAARSLTRVIGVLGTQATVRQPYVDRLSAEFAADCLVLRHGSARLVELAEARLRGAAVTARDVAPELGGLLRQPGGDRIDTVVLACTHFPLLQDLLGEAGGLTAAGALRLAFVDGAAGIARRVMQLIGGDAGAGEPVPVPATAVFTRGDASVDALVPALKRLGFGSIETL